jgi:hypothetical protein
MRVLSAVALCASLAGCIEGPVYGREDLAGIVLKPSEGPPGTALDRQGPESLENLEPYFGDLVEAGFVAAYGTSLGHEDVLSGKVEQGTLPGSEVRGVQSTVLLFESAEGAEAVLRGGRRGVAEGPFELEAWLSAEGLGEQGFGARALSSNDVTATLYEWHRGNLLLFLNAVGEFAVAQVRSLAETMDRRAQEALLT